MYKIAVIGDYDSIYGFATLGLSICPVKTREDARKKLKQLADGQYGIIYITEAVAAQIEEEIRTLKKACGTKILKVIIETCLLTQEEKIQLCEIVTVSGADYIKTSTGFSTAGATPVDIALFAKHVGKNVKIKAAGGISSFEDAEEFVRLGADRLGTSRLVKIRKES